MSITAIVADHNTSNILPFASHIKGLETTLDNVQKRCSVRVLTPESVDSALADIQSYLDQILFKTHQRGIELIITVPTPAVSGSYSGVPMATYIHLKKLTNGSWSIISAERKPVNQWRTKILNLDKFESALSKKAADVIFKMGRQ